MVNKKLKLRGKQKGFAIVTTLIISSVVLVLVGALFYKFSVNGKDIVQDSQRRQALAVAEEASSAYLSFVASLNNPTGKTDAQRIDIARLDASAFLVTDKTKFPGYVNITNAKTRAGYQQFKSASGKGEFEIKTDKVEGQGGLEAGFNPIKADIISYVPSKSAGALVRAFNLKFTRTFPPVAEAGTNDNTPPKEDTPPITNSPSPSPKVGKSGGKASPSPKAAKSGGKSDKKEKNNNGLGDTKDDDNTVKGTDTSNPGHNK